MNWMAVWLGVAVYVMLWLAYLVGYVRGRRAGFRTAKVSQVEAWVGFMQRPVHGWKPDQKRKVYHGPIPPEEPSDGE